MLSRISHTRLFAYQVPRSKGFSGQEYWSGLSFPPPDKRMQPNFPSLTLPRTPLQLLPQRRHSSLLPCRPAAPGAPVTGHSAPHPSPQLRGPSRRNLGSACKHCVLGTRPSLGRRSCYHAHSVDRKLRLREATHLPKHTQLKKKKTMGRARITPRLVLSITHIMTLPGDRLLLLEKLPPRRGSCGLPQPRAGKAGFWHNPPLSAHSATPPASSLWAGPRWGAGDTSLTCTQPPARQAPG